MPDKESDSHRNYHASSLTLQPIRLKKNCSQLSRQVEFIEIRRSSRLMSTGGRLEKAKASPTHPESPLQRRRKERSTKCNRRDPNSSGTRTASQITSKRTEQKKRSFFLNDKLAWRSKGIAPIITKRRKNRAFSTPHFSLKNEGASHSGGGRKRTEIGRAGGRASGQRRHRPAGGERGSRVRTRGWREICRERRRGSPPSRRALRFSLPSWFGRRGRGRGGGGGRREEEGEGELWRSPSRLRLLVWPRQLGLVEAWAPSRPLNCPCPHGRKYYCGFRTWDLDEK